jgi:hypothetical protein
MGGETHHNNGTTDHNHAPAHLKNLEFHKNPLHMETKVMILVMHLKEVVKHGISVTGLLRTSHN